MLILSSNIFPPFVQGYLLYVSCSLRSVSDLSKDVETQSAAAVEIKEKSPKNSSQITPISGDAVAEETKDNQSNQHIDQLKQRAPNEEETTEEVGKEKLFLVTKISEEQHDSSEEDPSIRSIESDSGDTTEEESQSLLEKTERKQEPEARKKKGVRLNVAPLATGELDSESMPATPRTDVGSTINSKEQVPLLEWEPKEEEVKSLLRNRKVEPVHIVSTVDGAKTQISFCVPFDQVRDKHDP